MKPRYRVGNVVYLFGTEYLKNQYDNHGTGKATVKEVVKKSEWRSETPEYIVSMNRKHYHIPQYSVDESGSLEQQFKNKKKAPKTKKA